MEASKRKRLLVSFSALGVTVAVLQATAIEYYLYWNFAWFDVLMHLLGGAFVALLFLWMFAALDARGYPLFSYPFKRPSAGMLTVLLLALLVGVGWELFELATGLLVERNYVFDTSLDLLADSLGAIAVIGIFNHTLYQYRNES